MRFPMENSDETDFPMPSIISGRENIRVTKSDS